MNASSSLSSLLCGALLVVSLGGGCGANAGEPAAATSSAQASLDHVVTDIDGKKVDLKAWRGKALLIVNVASECGYTPQYAELQQLHAKYEARGFSVLGFPSNDYGGQEPGDGAAIKKFASTEYGVTFPLFEKVSTSGTSMCPLYRTLTSAKGAVKWNFTKFLVDPAGVIVAKFDSSTAPLSSELTSAVERVLPKRAP